MTRLSFNETMDRLLLLIRAGYPVIYINSHEEMRVLDCLARIVNVINQDYPPGILNKQLWRWSEGIGLDHCKNLESAANSTNIDWHVRPGLPAFPKWHTHMKAQAAEDVLLAISNENALQNFPELADSVVVFFDIHQYLRLDSNNNSGSMVRPLRNTAAKLREYYDARRNLKPHRYTTLIIVAPTDDKLSPELDRDLIRLDFPLPELDELRLTMQNLIDRGVFGFPNPVSDEEFKLVCGDRIVEGDQERQDDYESLLSAMIANAGRGLTLEDFKLGLNMFAVTGKTLSASHITDMLNLKSKAVSNQALQYTPQVTINLGGLATVKSWIRLRKEPIINPDIRSKYNLPSPKGVMLCGVSGGGKSQLAKLIAKEFNLALLRLDVGALFGSYVGESERQTREALRLAEALAPVVLWLDEVDKAFTGISGGGDNGVSARVFGHFLTWLAEKQDDVFVVTTANNFKVLLKDFPEFGRKGRFDEIFWVGLPNDEARREIFRIYLVDKLPKDFFTVSPDDVEAARRSLMPANPIKGETPLDQFIWLLSEQTVSGNMTGAEIEYAVTEALYGAYKLDQKAGSTLQNNFTSELIAEVVSEANKRALHARDGRAGTELEELQNAARDNNWIFV